MRLPRVPIRRRPARPVEADPVPSNVVQLRPGTMLRADPEAPKATPKRARAKVTRTPDFLTKVTRETGEKANESSSLLRGPGLTQVIHSEALSPSPENATSARDPAFQRRVAKMSATKLREAFPLEASSHRNMLGRARDGGYTVDPAFRNFRTFLASVGPRPSEDFTLDRRDPRNPVYGPGLVRWSDKREQANNRADTVHLTIDGVTRPLADWARLTGQERRTLAKRIERGWSHAEAIRGRRIENEPAPSPPPATTTQVDGWPAGVTVVMWESAFTACVTQLGTHAASGVTRSVFFAWIGGNRLRWATARLAQRYPGFGEPHAPEPPAARLDPEFAAVTAYSDRVTEARRIAWADRQTYEALRALRARWPNVEDPNRAAQTIRAAQTAKDDSGW